MKFKSIALNGFKSFQKKTDFGFGPGITAVVGPNGCGKSNLVDAIKWVLGEKSAKSLRGSEMADVIFQGSDGRGPRNMAEVILTFDDTGNLLPSGDSELSIGRRIYRDGNSEYLINQDPCRLKDIRSLLLDTGLGVNAYSIAEQGKIDAVLQASSQDRRVIFEEAAGISKYKNQRRACQLKLERTDAHLLRFQDLLEELAKQIRSLKVQAGRARTYRELSARLTELRVDEALQQYHQLQERLAQAAARESAQRDALSGLTVRAEKVDRLLAELQATDDDLDRRLQAHSRELGEREAAISEARGRIAASREQVSDHEATHRRILQQLDALTSRVESGRERCRQQQAETERLAEIVAREEEQTRREGEALAGQEQELAAAEAAMTRRQEEHLRLIQEVSARQNELGEARVHGEILEGRRARLEIRRREISGALDQLSESRREGETRRLEEERALELLEKEKEERETAFATLEEECERRQRELTDQLQERSSLVSRRALLADLQARHEGLGAGARLALELAGRGEAPGVIGVLADLVDVELADARLVEAALGVRAQALVVTDLEAALAVSRQLRAAGTGRALLLPLELPGERPGDPAPLPERLARAIRWPEGLAGLGPRLLAGTMLAADLESGVAAWQGRTGRYLTDQGELIEADGLVGGGGPEPAGGFITRRAELKTLALDIERLDRAIETGRGELDERRRARAGAGEELRRLRQGIYEEYVRLQERQAQQRRVHEETDRLREEVSVLDSERADIERDLAAISERSRERGEQRDDLVRQRDGLGQELAREESALAARREGLRQRREGLGARRVETAKRAEQQRSLVQALDREAQALRENEAHLRAAQEEMEQRLKRRDECLAEIRERSAFLEQAENQRQDLAGKADFFRANREEIREVRAEKNREREELAAARSAAEEQRHALDLERHDCRVRLDNLAERMAEECRVDLAAAYRDFTARPAADWEAVRQEIEELRGRLDRLGNVNLAAIDELQARETEYKEKQEQQEDLIRTRESLQAIIRRVNKRSRELFQETFVQIQKNFREIYRKLFGGGKADVQLEPDKDVLEAGIEIMASPPGKGMRSLLSLSGGEKVMTAVALIFAVFKSKPSPFCVLDEVDAALDEANIDRFTGMVKDFLAQSQFIVVTHNKQTMAIADIIYGVTMEEPGVSKKVEVDFSDAQEWGE